MSFFGKNIKKIRGVKGLSQQAFADLFQLKRGTLGAYEEGRSEPKIETIIKIANYFSIPIDDLLTNELTVNKLLRFKGDFTIEAEELHKEISAVVPCITEKKANDYIKYFDKVAFVNDLPKMQLPINSEKDFRAFTVTSLEMTNYDKGLYPKDVVVGEFVPKDDIKKLNNGTMVLVLTDEQLVLRRLYITKNKLALRADHVGIEDVTVDIASVKELWSIQYVFLKRLPDFGDDLMNQFKELKEEIINMKEKLD